MANLTIARNPKAVRETLQNVYLPLAAQKVWRGGSACYDTSALGSVKKAAVSTTLVSIGMFMQDVDNSAGSAGGVSILVRLQKEIEATWWEITGTITVAANLFGLVYWADDHTVTATSTGASVAGRVWDVDSAKGCLIEYVGNTGVL